MTNSGICEKFNSMKLKAGLKQEGEHNPVITQRFGADPYALVYEGRVYLKGSKLYKCSNGKLHEVGNYSGKFIPNITRKFKIKSSDISIISYDSSLYNTFNVAPVKSIFS